jgi:stage IV sporulation protein FB
MTWSVPVGRLFGTTIRIHLTFLILLAWIAAAHFAVGGADAAVRGTAFIVALFACVVLHEFGHILMARRFGVETRDVILLPIGGVTRMGALPRAPGQELAVALAGPAVNVAIAAILIAASGGLPDAGIGVLADIEADFWARLALANLAIGAFNLLPAFPMDGGRALRALLALRLSHVRATQVASKAGQAFALLFGLLGLLASNPILLFIALFVYLGAGSEALVDRMRDVAGHLVVADAAMTDLATIDPAQPVADAADLLLRGAQREMPVVDGGHILAGLLTRDDIVRALRDGRQDMPIDTLMRTDIPVFAPTDPLLAAIDRMTVERAPAIAVVGADGRYHGLVTLENLAELMLVREAETGLTAVKPAPANRR